MVTKKKTKAVKKKVQVANPCRGPSCKSKNSKVKKLIKLANSRKLRKKRSGKKSVPKKKGFFGLFKK